MKKPKLFLGKEKQSYKARKRYLALVKQYSVSIAIYIVIAVTFSVYYAQQFGGEMIKYHSLNSRGLLDVSDNFKKYPATVGTFFHYSLNQSFMEYMPIMIIAICVLIFMLYYKERNIVIITRVSAFPFTKKERFTIRFILGLISLTIAYISYSAIVLHYFNINKEWISKRNNFADIGDIFIQYDSLEKVLISISLGYLSIIIMYLFLLLIMCFMGKLFISLIEGLLLMGTPLFIIEIIKAVTKNEVIYETLKPFLSFPNLMFQSTVIVPVENMNCNGIISFIQYPMVKIIYGLLLICILTVFVYKVYHKNEVQNIGFLFMFSSISQYFVIMQTIMAGLFSAYIAIIYLNNSLILAVILGTIGSGVGYIVSSKMLEADRK